MVVALTFVAAAVALITGLILIDRSGEAILEERQRSVAASARDYFVAFAHEEGLGPLARALDLQERGYHDQGFRYALFSNQGLLMGGARLLAYAALPKTSPSQVTLNKGGAESEWRVMVQPISTGGTLVVYENLASRGEFRRALLLGGAVSLVLALGATLAVSLWFLRLIYRRADAIALTAADIADGKRSARAPAEVGGDVFDRMGEAINHMLDRNEELVTELRAVTDSLAHDLRTPLTRMRSALARALDRDVDEPGRMAAIGKACDEADGALATTSAILDIARAETGLSRDQFQTVDLRALATDIADLFAPVIEDAGQTLTIETGPPILLRAHETLLRQAIGNLLHNAARHAGPGAAAVLSFEDEPGFARCIVADSGQGIAPEDRTRVMERFVRLDQARTKPGSGLGLAIVAACAKLHRGTVRLEDNAPGLRMVLEIGRP